MNYNLFIRYRGFVWLAALYAAFTGAFLYLVIRYRGAEIYILGLALLVAMDFYFGYRFLSRGVFVSKNYITVRSDDKSMKFERNKVTLVTVRIYNDVSVKRDKADITVLKNDKTEYNVSVDCFFMSKSGMFCADLSEKAVEKLKKKADGCALVKIDDRLYSSR